MTIVAKLLIFFVLIGSASNMSASSRMVEAHGLPKRSVNLFSSDDPTFDGELKSLLRGKPAHLADKLKKVSVLIQNQNERAIVGYCLRWELTDVEGNSISRAAIYLEPSSLKDAGRSKYNSSQKAIGSKILPGTARIVSLAGSFDEFSPIEAITAKPEFGGLAATLSSATTIIVSIDGVLFDDGTFVGPDLCGSFGRMTATFRGEQDFFSHVISLVEKGESSDVVMERVANVISSSEQPNISAAERDYLTAKRLRAEEFVNIAQGPGFDAAVEHCRTLVYRTFPDFRKEVER